jgi:hypothetical protein
MQIFSEGVRLRQMLLSALFLHVFVLLLVNYFTGKKSFPLPQYLYTTCSFQLLLPGGGSYTLAHCECKNKDDKE